jgi:monoamine oxidase
MFDDFGRPSRRTFLAGSAAAVIAGAAPRRARAAAEADVLIIGAGLSGLNAAYNLESQGLNVAVIEGRNRIGGRLYTLDAPGRPEAGGNGIGGAYARIIDTAERLKLKLVDRAERQNPALQGQGLYFKGKYFTRETWEGAAENIFQGPRKKMLPWELVSRTVQPGNPLNDAESWLDPAFAKYDVMLNDVLLQAGLNQDEIDLAYNINTGYGSSSFDISVMMLYSVGVFQRIQNAFGGEGTREVEGGNQRLPEAMAKSLKGEVRLKKRVVALRSFDSHAEAVLDDGTIFRAKHVVCSMPLTAMRNIRFEPSLPSEFAMAVKTVRYQKITQIHMVAKDKYWEKDGRLGNMWTDTEAGRTLVMRSGAGKGGDVTSASWHNGMLADMTDRLPEKEAKERVLKAIAAYRPSTKGKLEVTGMKSWQNDPFAGGAWAIWGPGQVQWVKATAQPLGRIHFCGEHTGQLSRGMEAAMESGERAAFEVLERAG